MRKKDNKPRINLNHMINLLAQVPNRDKKKLIKEWMLVRQVGHRTLIEHLTKINHKLGINHRPRRNQTLKVNPLTKIFLSSKINNSDMIELSVKKGRK